MVCLVVFSLCIYSLLSALSGASTNIPHTKNNLIQLCFAKFSGAVINCMQQREEEPANGITDQLCMHACMDWEKRKTLGNCCIPFINRSACYGAMPDKTAI
jgi:hypothetical protein